VMNIGTGFGYPVLATNHLLEMLVLTAYGILFLFFVIVLLRCIREFSCAVHGMEVCFG